MTGADTTPYDVIFYPGHAYGSTHPERLATIASIYGMQPASPERCRVLELGCGEGANLIPMAYGYPNSEFVGLDLSGHAIDQASKHVATLGLNNIDFRRSNIMTVTDAWGQFDYIIAHGVYSWVPPDVREKMLSIFKSNLSRQGVTYVSYNSHPGSHLRDLTRDMMLFHVRHIAEPRKRTGQARAILKFLSESSDATTVHGAVMRDQYNRVQKMGDAILFHDDLDEISTPFLLHQMVGDAARHGLQYLGDATFSRRDLTKLNDETRRILDQFPASDFMARDQYQDFIEGHGFRRTLLCHDDIELRRQLAPDFVRGLHLSSSAKPVSNNADVTANDAMEFKTDQGASLSTAHPLTNAAILHLGSRWPEAVSFEALVENAQRILTERSSRPVVAAPEDIEKLLHVMALSVCGGHLEGHFVPPRLTASVSERPRASLIARKQAEAGTLITNLRHEAMQLEDGLTRRFIQFVDGSRDIDALLVDFKVALGSSAAGEQNGAESVDPESITRANVEKNLRSLARLGLLER